MERSCRALPTGLVALLLLVVGCVQYPRNGEAIPADGTMLEFGGAVSRPNSHVALRMKNYVRSNWTDLAWGFQSSSEGFTDAVGARWYDFDGRAHISRSRDLWRSASSSGSQRRIRAELGLYDRTDGYLSSFDVDADECLSRYDTVGLLALINECRSDNSPDIEVFRNCGKPDQDCCTAHNVATTEQCDPGRTCSVAGKCTIRSGRLNEPCSPDGSCMNQLACIAGTCRDAAIEDVPAVTMELEIRTCSQANLLNNNGNSNADLWIDFGTGEEFYLEAPGDQGRLGQTDRYGISVPGVVTLGDIAQLRLWAMNDRMCLDRIRLHMNGRRVFEKTWASPALIDPTLPLHATDSLTIALNEMRTQWTQLDQATYCAAPTSISGTALQRAVTGLVGHGIRDVDLEHYNDACDNDDDCGESGMMECNDDDRCRPLLNDIHFAADDSVTITPVDNDTFHMRAYFTGERDGGVVDDANVTLRLDADITPRCANGALSVQADNERMIVHDFDFISPVGQVLNAITLGQLETVAQMIANLYVIGSDSSLAGQLAAFDRAVPLCPTPAVTSESPPAITFAGVGGINLCAF